MQQILHLLKNIFEKLYKDCAKMIDVLKFQQINLESISNKLI